MKLLTLLLAGVVYHFTATSISTHGAESTRSGRVWIDGERYRLELDPDPGAARTYDVAISTDGDVTAKLINRQRGTWFDRQPHRGTTRTSPLFDIPLPGAAVRGRPKITHRQEGLETIAGRAARKHVIDIEYTLYVEFGGSPVRGKVKATALIWSADDLPRLPMRRNLHTGHAAVDQKLDAIFEQIGGLPLREELTVTRRYEGGPPTTEVMKSAVDELKIEDVAPSQFEVPAGYLHEDALTRR